MLVDTPVGGSMPSVEMAREATVSVSYTANQRSGARSIGRDLVEIHRYDDTSMHCLDYSQQAASPVSSRTEMSADLP